MYIARPLHVFIDDLVVLLLLSLSVILSVCLESRLLIHLIYSLTCCCTKWWEQFLTFNIFLAVYCPTTANNVVAHIWLSKSKSVLSIVKTYWKLQNIAATSAHKKLAYLQHVWRTLCSKATNQLQHFFMNLVNSNVFYWK